jgi:hypothetical protein
MVKALRKPGYPILNAGRPHKALQSSAFRESHAIFFADTQRSAKPPPLG